MWSSSSSSKRAFVVVAYTATATLLLLFTFYTQITRLPVIKTFTSLACHSYSINQSEPLSHSSPATQQNDVAPHREPHIGPNQRETSLTGKHNLTTGAENRHIQSEEAETTDTSNKNSGRSLHRPRVEVFIVMWEDMLLLLYAVRFYRERLGRAGLRITVYDNESKDGSVELARALGCHVVSFSSGGKLSDSKYIEVKSNCWKKSEADWVVIVDVDEWLDIRPTDLDDYEGRNITIINAEPSVLIWKNDTHDLTDPPYSTPLIASEEVWYTKPCLFDRRKITQYSINPGGHTLAKQEGQINWLHNASSPVASPRLYHVKYFDEKFLLNRYEKYNQRMSEENLRRGWGTHYHVHEVSKTFEERRKILEPVPGLRKGASIFQIEEGLREATDIGSQDSITLTSAGAGPKLTPWHDQEDELYPLHLFEEMFVPLKKKRANTTTCRSFVMIVAGKSAMANVDKLVRLWGLERFEYALVHYDESSAAWNKFGWYKKVISLTAQRQGKWWYVKRFAHPSLLKNYCYFHIVEADTGSPPEHPFKLGDYEDLLLEHDIPLAQPALSPQSRTNHEVVRRKEGNIFRPTEFVEIGPLVSLKPSAYTCLWEFISPEYVTGFGLDIHWCRYLSERCGFPSDKSNCAVIDEHYIDHLDTKSASGAVFNGRTYEEYGNEEIGKYGERMTLIRERSAAGS